MNIYNYYEKQIISIDSPDYPQKLKGLLDAPQKLFAIGNVSLLNKTCISIVGTRKSTAFGEELSFNYAKTLSKAGIVIVSGLAYGIDISAHNGAIEHGYTIAVVAGGLKNTISSGKFKMAKKILDSGGLIISEYDDNIPPQDFTFLCRNRIIAGLSLATIVVEAPKSSGALNTAHHAFTYERKVFATPYNLNSFNGEGCNSLFLEGASPLVNISQVFDYINSQNIQISFFDESNLENKKIRNIPNIYKEYYEYIKENAPVSEEQIISSFSNKSVSSITSDLSFMEINDFIKLQDGFYVAI